MPKTILITGATDGIGLETAKRLFAQGHYLILHGRNADKLKLAVDAIAADGSERIETVLADLSSFNEVDALAETVLAKHAQLDVLINNAGVLKTSSPITSDGLDVRFVVNTLAPYRLTQKLLPLFANEGRVVNLSSAAQSPVHPDALRGKERLSDDMAAYAQSKLAITMWSVNMATALAQNGPMIVAVNPGSLLATNMVKEGFGIAGNDIGIGADILVRAALSDEFANAGGRYFDNDSGQFSAPHSDATDLRKCEQIVQVIEEVLTTI